MTLLKAERQDRILSLINGKGQVEVSRLSERFEVSTMTIRRDLDELQSRGAIRRVHGGARPLGQDAASYSEPPVLDRMKSQAIEKKAIARELRGLIGSGESIFLGSGSTTLFIAQALAGRDDLTVVTNSLPVLYELTRSGQMTVIGVGGFLRRSEQSMIGHFAEAIIGNLHVDRVIIGMRGVHPRRGLTNDHPQELATDRVILESGREVIVAVDSTKFGHVASSLTAPLEAADLIVTTERAPMPFIEAIRDKGIDVRLTSISRGEDIE